MAVERETIPIFSYSLLSYRPLKKYIFTLSEYSLFYDELN